MNIENTLSSSITSGNPLAYILTLAAGIVTSFTPCVYPVIPIIVGYIGTQQVKSRSGAFLLSSAYVIGMAVTFSLLGIIASLTGKIFGRIQSNPLTYVFVGAVILAMTLWFMDIIHIPLPAAVMPRMKSRGYLPAFLLGMASGVITAPCTAAVLAIILTYVASKQNVLFGGTLLFTYALGLGTLLIIAGTFTGFINTVLKSDTLSRRLKTVFGILLLIFSLSFFYKAWKMYR